MATTNEAIKEEIVVLFHAASLGRTDIVQSAISTLKSKCSPEDVNKIISSGRPEDDATPLHIASMLGHSDVIRALLNNGVNMSAKPTFGDHTGKRPYDVASDASRQTFHVYMFEQIAMGNVGIITNALKGGIPVDVVDGSKLDDSSLHWACSFGNVEVAKLLLTYGSNINTTNAEGQTGLHLAVKGANVPLVETLLLEGADLSLVDTKGCVAKDLNTRNVEKINELLDNPPQPTYVLRNIYLESLAAQQAEAGTASTSSANDDIASVSLAADEMPPTPENVVATVVTASAEKQTTPNPSTDTDDAYDSDIADEDEKKDPLLVIWPPPQRQRRESSTGPLILSSTNPVLICVASANIDIFSLLTWSGMFDALERFSLLPQVKRTAAGAKIRVSIDPIICPGRHRFDLSISQQQAVIIASDPTGLFYAAYAFVQLLQLHTEVSAVAGVATVYVPAISISDWPDVANRAVLWSHRRNARMSAAAMQEQVQLLSRLRINMVFLVVDAASSDDDYDEFAAYAIEETPMASSPLRNGRPGPSAAGPNALASVGAGAGPVSGPGPGSVYLTNTPTTNVYALDEVCKRHCVDLVPSVVLTSVRDRMPFDMLKNFSHPSVSISFLLERDVVARELAADREDADISSGGGGGGGGGGEDFHEAQLQAACCRVCEDALASAQQAGFSVVWVTCSAWAKAVANPLALAMRMGLSACESPLVQHLPPGLFLKPFLSTGEFIRALAASAKASSDRGLTMSVLPAFMETDFGYPVVLLKYCCLLHAGFSWNRAIVLDMLGLAQSPPNQGISSSSSSSASKAGASAAAAASAPAHQAKRLAAKAALVDAAILKEVVSLIMFSKQEDQLKEKDTKGDGGTVYTSVLGLLTGELMLQSDPQASAKLATGGTGAAGATAAAAAADGNELREVSPKDISTVEAILWSLVSATPAAFDAAAPPSKEGTSKCLRFYRRLLLNVKYRVVSPHHRGPTGIDAGKGAGAGAGAGNKDDDFPAAAYTQELEELFSAMHMLSILCRAIVLAYNAAEKKGIKSAGGIGGTPTMGALLAHLPLGTKSDITNLLLEALEHYSYLLKKRFEHLAFRSLTSSISAGPSGLFVTADNKKKKSGGGRRGGEGAEAVSPTTAMMKMANSLVRDFQGRYLLEATPQVPMLVMFRAIGQAGLPLQAAEDMLHRLFPLTGSSLF